MRTVLPILFVLLFASCGVGLALQGVLLARLRSRFPQTWEALGRPTFLNNRFANGMAVLRFLWRRDYHALGDTEFSRFAGFLRGYMAAYLVLFILTLMIFAVSMSIA